MSIFEIILMAVALAMDAFAVAICKGLATNKVQIKHMVVVGAWFGIFQALMPFIGCTIGAAFLSYIEAVDHWIAFILLGCIGGNMIKESLSKEEECDCTDASLSFKVMLTMAVATSIDALAVGISLAMAGNVNIWVAMALIGIVTFAMSAVGVKIGNVFGSRYEKKAEAVGGFILIGLGIKVLIDHCFWEIFL